MRRGQPVKRRATKAAVRISRAPELNFASGLGVTPALVLISQFAEFEAPTKDQRFRLVFCRVKALVQHAIYSGRNCGLTIEHGNDRGYLDHQLPWAC